jgi:hypothetical protein
MRTTLSLLLALLLAPAISAQVNFVKNGDFTATSGGLPTNWTVTSQTFHNANVADFTFNGVNYFKNSFNCAPGGASGFSRPYPLVILEQDLVLPPQAPIEFFAEIAHSRKSSVTNADRGQFKVYLGSQLLSTVPSSRKNLVGPDTLTETIHFRTSLAAGGKLKLKITMERYYYATDVLCHLDNVFLGITNPPGLSIAGDRILGSQMNLRLLGDPNGSALVFMATGPSPIPGGLALPGISGNFNLDFTRFFPLGTYPLGTTGTFTGSGGTIPNDPVLAGIPLWFQAFQATTAPAYSFGMARPFAWY